MFPVFADHGTVNRPTFQYYNADHHGTAERVTEAAMRALGRVPASQDVVSAYGNADEGDMTAGLHRAGPAAAEWACSGVATASQTLMSGKLNEFINLVVREGYMASRRRNQWRIKAQASPGSRWRDFFNGLFYAFKNQLARGAAFAGSRFVNPAMEIASNVWKTALMFFFEGDHSGRHNYNARAELFLPAAILFALGLGVAVVIAQRDLRSRDLPFV